LDVDFFIGTRKRSLSLWLGERFHFKERKMEIDWLWLLPFTRRGWLRALLRRIAPSIVWVLDGFATLQMRVGIYRWEWTADWSVDTMTGIVCEKIRRAPRLQGLARFLLEIEDVDALEADGDSTTETAVRAYLEKYAPAAGESIFVRLLLPSEVAAKAAQYWQWRLG
jgi:hypothetical protein